MFCLDSGYFFRTDRESFGKQNYIALNMDISLWGNEITPIAPFIKKIDEFDIIHTDRLHVAILACLLHKRVHFYKGGYFKNEAVFRSSMRDYFDDVFMKNISLQSHSNKTNGKQITFIFLTI